mgnify:CR=1 FL=1
MGTLYIDRKGLQVRMDGEALAFYLNGKREGMVPIRPLQRVVMVGNISVEASVLHRLALRGISVLFLTGRRQRFCGILHGSLHNNGLLRVRQYQKSLSPFCLQVASELIERKLTAQRDLLTEALQERPDLRFPLKRAMEILCRSIDTLLGTPADIDTIRGIEGSAATAYLSGYTSLFPSSLGFKGRNRRPPRDPVNAMLSLCYTFLHWEMVREVECIGLDPTIGFYHQFEYGRESLACDLVEPHRPEVDRFVWRIFRERRFRDRDFNRDSETSGCYLKKAGRKRFYPIYEEWAKQMRPKWREEVRRIARRIMDGQDPLLE